MTKEAKNLHFHANHDLHIIAKTINTPLEKTSEHEVSIQPDKPEVKGQPTGWFLIQESTCCF